MRYLLFPDEERQLIVYLADHLALTPLSSSLAPDHEPQILENPTAAIGADFPAHLAAQGPSDNVEPWEILFWCEALGPIVTLGDSPDPDDAVERVSRLVTREATDDWQDVIDLCRTPVLRWQRPAWYRRDRSCVTAALLQSMTIKVKDYPVELRRLYDRVDRWLSKSGARINPFDFCRNTPVPEPNNLNAFWTMAWPVGKRWLDNGGELWPWSG